MKCQRSHLGSTQLEETEVCCIGGSSELLELPQIVHRPHSFLAAQGLRGLRSATSMCSDTHHLKLQVSELAQQPDALLPRPDGLSLTTWDPHICPLAAA